MRIQRMLLAGALLAGTGVARADVSLDYRFTAAVTKLPKPMVTEHVLCDMTATRSKTRIWLDLSGISQAAPIPVPQAAQGTMAFTQIQRLDDDRFIVMNSFEPKKYREDTVEGAWKKMRLDIWKDVSPNPALADQEPPRLTPDQLDRLGAEARAAYGPYTDKVWKIFYRPLQEARTFNGTAGKGYRMTWLVNAGAAKKGQEQWVRIVFEWWVTPPVAGDEVIPDFVNASAQKRGGIGYPTTSMWINELAPVLWSALPQELHDAAATVMPPDGSFPGIVQQMSVVVTPPATPRAEIGDIRLDLTLNKHDNSPIEPTVFDPPADFEKLPMLSPFDQFKQYMPKGMPKMADADKALGFTWQAWHEAAKNCGRATPFPAW